MLLNLFCKLFLNSTLLKFGGSSFGLPDNFTVVGMLLEFGKRFPAFNDSGLAVELRDRLVWEFSLNNVEQNFKIPRFGCLTSRPVQPDEDLLLGLVVRQGDEDFLPLRVGPFARA
jgi:hypothetical protein